MEIGVVYGAAEDVLCILAQLCWDGYEDMKDVHRARRDYYKIARLRRIGSS
jgi:hypothetical protein